MNSTARSKVYNGALLMAHAFQFDRQYWQLGIELLKRGLSEFWGKSE